MSLRRLWAVIRKEFIHAKRDTRTMVIVLIMPLLQMILMGYTSLNDIEDIPMAICDLSRSAPSRDLISAYRTTGIFVISYVTGGESEIVRLLDEGKIQIGMVIRPDYKEGQMPTFPDPIREQLIEARRNQILDAAAAVFAEKGFHRATTKEIANTASVSEGTIYNYFDSKADLLIGIMTRLAELEHLDQELADALQSDARDFLIAIFRQRMGLVQQKGETILAIMPEILVNPALRERFYQQFARPTTTLFEQYIQTRIELGHIRPLNVPLAVRAVQGMFVGLVILRILGDEQLLSGWDELPEVLATLIFDGLSPRDGG